jgi:hypothetical protein
MDEPASDECVTKYQRSYGRTSAGLHISVVGDQAMGWAGAKKGALWGGWARKFNGLF